MRLFREAATTPTSTPTPARIVTAGRLLWQLLVLLRVRSAVPETNARVSSASSLLRSLRSVLGLGHRAGGVRRVQPVRWRAVAARERAHLCDGQQFAAHQPQVPDDAASLRTEQEGSAADRLLLQLAVFGL